MRTARAWGIIVVFLAVTLAGIPCQAFNLRFRPRAARRFPGAYHRFMARLFGIRISVIGHKVAGDGTLLVANHTSWMDIIVFSAVTDLSFIAKSEVAQWPLFSTLSKLQRTVFVERTRRQATGDARDQIRERLMSGDTLILFPEGTSSDGNRVLPFKSALMGAVETRIRDSKGQSRPVRVQPVTATYVGLHGLPMGRENRPLFAWYGDMELVPHMWEALKTGPIDVVVEFHAPLDADRVGGRKALAVLAESLVRRGQMRALAGLAGPTPPPDMPAPALPAPALPSAALPTHVA